MFNCSFKNTILNDSNVVYLQTNVFWVDIIYSGTVDVVYVVFFDY